MKNYIVTLTNGSKASVLANNAVKGNTPFVLGFDGGCITFEYPIADIEEYECVETKQEKTEKPVMNIEAVESKRTITRALISVYLDELYIYAISNKLYDAAMKVNAVRNSKVKYAPVISTILSDTDKDKMLRSIVVFYDITA